MFSSISEYSPTPSKFERLSFAVRRFFRLLRNILALPFALVVGLAIFAPVFALSFAIFCTITTLAAVGTLLHFDFLARACLRLYSETLDYLQGRNSNEQTLGIRSVQDRVKFIIGSPFIALVGASILATSFAFLPAAKIYLGVQSLLNFVTKPLSKLFKNNRSQYLESDDDFYTDNVLEEQPLYAPEVLRSAPEPTNESPKPAMCWVFSSCLGSLFKKSTDARNPQDTHALRQRALFDKRRGTGPFKPY